MVTNISLYCPINNRWYEKQDMVQVILQENYVRAFELRRHFLEEFENLILENLHIDNQILLSQNLTLHDLIYVVKEENQTNNLVRAINISRFAIREYASDYSYESFDDLCESERPTFEFQRAINSRFNNDYRLVIVTIVDDDLIITGELRNHLTTNCCECGNRHYRYYSVCDEGYNDFCSDDCESDYSRRREEEYDDDDYDSAYRKADTKSTKFQSKNAVLFGIELEFTLECNSDIKYISQEIPQEFGIVTDGSISDGFEIVSPILSGMKGYRAIESVTNVLKKYHASVDTQCGYHLHIEGKKLLSKTEHLQKLVSIYMSFEDIIVSFLPVSRRTNTYAKRITEFYSYDDLVREKSDIAQFESSYYKTTDSERIENIKQNHYASQRYYGLNLHSLFSDSHYEVRYHSGTVDYEKITKWIQLNLAIYKIATDENIRFRDIQEKLNKIDIMKKTSYLYDLINLPVRTRAYFNKRQRLFSDNQELVESV